MNVYAIVLIIVAAVCLFGGVYMRKYGKKVDDYYLMGRQAPGWMIGASTMASWGTLWAWIGAIGFAWQFGPVTPLMFYGSCWGMLLLCLLLAKMLRRGEFRTLSHYFSERYSDRVSYVAAFVIAIGTVFYLFPQFSGAGSIVLSSIGIPYSWSIAIFSLFVLVFVLLGGMASAIFFGAFMFIIMIFSSVGFPFAASAASGVPISQVVIETAKTLGNQYWSALGFDTHSTGYWVAQVGSWIAIASISGHIISLSLACKSERELDKGFGMALPINSVVLMTMYCFCGLLIFVVERGSMPVDFLAAHIYTQAFPLWAGVVLVVGCIAAALSSVAAMFVTIATNLVNDFGRYINPNLKEETILKGTKITFVLVGFLCIPLGYYAPGGLIVVATGFMGAFLLSCVFLPIAVGAYWSAVSEKAVFYNLWINLPICFFMVVTNMAMGWFAPSPLYWLMPISTIIFFTLVFIFKPTEQDNEKWVAFYHKVHSYQEEEEALALDSKKKLMDALPVMISVGISIVMLIVYLRLILGGSA